MTTAIRISNNLYGICVASAYELAKTYIRPIHGNNQIPLPDEIRVSHEDIVAQSKLSSILKSKTVSKFSVLVRDIIDIFIQRQNEGRSVPSS